MLKKYLIISLIIFTLTGCTSNEIDKEVVNNKNTIQIDKININEELNIASINNYVNGIVLFKEYSMPNEEGTIVVAAHSGTGSNAYFNDLILLNKNDKIIIEYANITYIYNVLDVKEVNVTDIAILTNKVDLILLSCKI